MENDEHEVIERKSENLDPMVDPDRINPNPEPEGSNNNNTTTRKERNIMTTTTKKNGKGASAKKASKAAKAATRVGRPPALTDEQVAEAVERVKKGSTIAEIHALKRFEDVSPATIANAVRRVLGERPRGRKAPNADEAKEIVALYEGRGKDPGMGMEHVAKKVGYSVPTIRKVLEANGTEIRTVADYE